MTSPQANPIPPGPPTSISDQINRLLQRGMLITDPERAERFLSNVNFYRFRGYLEPFIDQAANPSRRPFQPCTTFEAVAERYEFDTRLRSLLLDAFNRIEVSIRTQWTYHLSYTVSGGEYAHLNPQLFSKEYGKNSAQLRQEYRQHGQRLHGYDFNSCPTWAIAEVMTFGLLSRWYGDTTKEVRRLVARHYQLHERILGALLRHLAPVRNFCAHHERLWDRDFITKLTVPKRLGAFANPSAFFNHAETGKLYNSLVMMAYLTNVISDSTEWGQRLVTLMTQQPNIPQSQMGFVPHWQELDIWKS